MILSHLTAPLAALARGAALATALALPAAAATMQAVYTGTVTGSDDRTGVFGGTGSSLDGAAFTATIRYDTALGAISDNGYSQELNGGSSSGRTSPVFYAALTINGVTQAFDAEHFASVFLYDDSSLGGTGAITQHLVQDYSDDGVLSDTDYFSVSLAFYDGSVAVPLDLTQPFSAEIDPQNGNHAGTGDFSFTDYDYGGTGTYPEYATGRLIATKVVVTAFAPVPLPAGLPLLLLALGGLALVARRRRVTGA